MRITRFPPEPNGFIHLGHAKAMRFDFDLHKGEDDYCILRMDDTNPEVEKQEYVDAIVEDVTWLGYKFKKLTYTSDYFDDLYNFALILIKNDFAYIDLSSCDLIKEMRHNGVESEYRLKSVEWNLEQFEKMKLGFYKENDAVLRLKIDMQNDNHCLRDPIAYRIKYTPHYRTMNKYCIYPSYDYSHGIVDALENVTDSYCTTEFLIRRDLYYWPVLKLKELGICIKEASVIEFGRLNIEHIELSKRKIIPLVEQKKILGFDDPRLYTIRGLRRRGFTPEIIKNIVSHVNMDRNESLISKSLIDFEIRNYLNKVSHRVFAVIEPLKIINNDLSIEKTINCNHPNHPNDESIGSHDTILSREIFIEKSDFRDVDSPDYYRLAPGKTIRLKYSQFVNYVSHDANNGVVNVCDSIPDKPRKVKGIIHWVSTNSPKAFFEIYEPLYENGKIVDNPQINVYDGYVEPYVIEAINKNITHVFQFERLGFFKFDRFDKTQTPHIPIFIRIIELVDRYNI